jgi:hypothetical protein
LVFVAVGLDNELKPLPFSLAAGSYFFCWRFSFYTAGFGAFVFWLQLGGDGVAACFFKKQFLKSYQVFAVLAFVVAVWGRQNYCFCKQQFLCRQTVTDFFCRQFLILKTAFVL